MTVTLPSICPLDSPDTCGLAVTGAVPSGVVCSFKGAWLATNDNGQTASALCPSHRADVSEGACFNDARAEAAALAA